MNKTKMNRKALGLVALGAALAAMELGKECVKYKEFKRLEHKVNRLGNCHNGFVEHVLEQEDETNARFEQLEEEVGACYGHMEGLYGLIAPEESGE